MYIIIASSTAIAKNGSPYCKLSVRSLEDAFDINIWNCKKQFKVGDSVDIRNIQDKDGFKSTSADNVFVHSTPADSPLWQFIPKPPTKGDWYSLCNAAIELIIDVNQKQFIKTQFEKLYQPYSQGVGGRSNHHAFKGGLLQHTYEIINMYVAVYKAIPFKTNPFILILSALYHDFGKLMCYRPDDFSYTEHMFLVNHVASSADMLVTIMRASGFDSRLIMHCQHCVLAHHELLEYGSPVRPSTVEAEVLAMLDRISGHGTQIYNNATIEGTQVRNLGTTCFKYE